MATTTDSLAERWSDSTQSVRLWAAAVLFFLVGDVVTTWLGLASNTVAEVGPLAAPLIGTHGILALPVLKAGVLLATVLVWRYAPPAYASALPLGLAVGGGLVTMWNTIVLFQTMV